MDIDGMRTFTDQSDNDIAGKHVLQLGVVHIAPGKHRVRSGERIVQ